jgi:pimeloyl-ACP methyl ester carboxylesterase
MRTLAVILLASALGVLVCQPAAADSSSAPTVSPVIVIGFVGGFVHRDSMIHSEVQLVAKLRSGYPSGVYADILENHKSKSAYPEILRLLDANGDGTLTDAEKRSARIILYGHSWGASAAVALARQLQKDGIPVLLTIQVDSVEKGGQDDALIPANVAEAVNFYQPHGLLHGRQQIRAADPRRTTILGNYRFDYTEKPVACDGEYPWWDRFVSKAHTEIECDPSVWNQVENLIRGKLPPAASSASVPPAVPSVGTLRAAEPSSDLAKWYDPATSLVKPGSASEEFGPFHVLYTNNPLQFISRMLA